ncbi:MAG: hypothetical protein Q9212_001453 [Teloschistes hypoglaucus]
MDSRQRDYIIKLPPPPPPPEMPPLSQRRPSASSDRFSRGGDSWSAQARPQATVPQSDFTFRNDPSAPRFPPNGDHYRSSDHNRSSDYYRPSNDRAQTQNRHHRSAPHQRGRGPRYATATRPLLSSNRGGSPEQLLAQADLQNTYRKFLPTTDLSDSDEEEMDESDEGSIPIPDPMKSLASASGAEAFRNGMDTSDTALDAEPPAKRRATTQVSQDSNQAASVPKWSNPDPYTVLPPVDEPQRKRKDVVKIIRKARIPGEKELTDQSQAAANDDFISFGLEGDNVSNKENRSSSPSEPEITEGRGMPGAPVGPRSFSHLNNLYDVAGGAPGIVEARPSASDLGPPPSMTYSLPEKPEHNVKIQQYYPDQAEALGNRKRTHNDEIVGQARANAKGKKQPVANGSILGQWVAHGSTDPTPWLVDDHRLTENPGFRLHKEVCDFYEYVRPQGHEQIIREDLLQRLQIAVQNTLPDCKIYCFGSFAAGIYLPNADMDLVVISSTFQTSGRRIACQNRSEMLRFANHLQRIGLAEHRSVEIIPSAKVPLVKFVDSMTAIRVDVSFENETGMVANSTFNLWKQRFPAMPILTTLIKQFLMMRGLNEVVNGGLGGFSVTCLVTSLLQNLPRVQSGEIQPEQHLGEMLLEFLDLYGNQFDLARTGISMNPPEYYDKQAEARRNQQLGVYYGNASLEKLTIKDPNNSSNDISGGSRNISLIFRLFSQAHNEIMKNMRSQDRMSLLDWMLGGSYESFVTQRQRLQELYKTKWGFSEANISGALITPVGKHNGTRNNLEPGDRQPIRSLNGLFHEVYSNPVNSNVKIIPLKVVQKQAKFKAKKKKPQPNSNHKNNDPSSANNTPIPLGKKRKGELTSEIEAAGVPRLSKRPRAGQHGRSKNSALEANVKGKANSD